MLRGLGKLVFDFTLIVTYFTLGNNEATKLRV